MLSDSRKGIKNDTQPIVVNAHFAVSSLPVGRRSHSIALEDLWPKSQFRIYVTRSTGTWKRHKQANTCTPRARPAHIFRLRTQNSRTSCPQVPGHRRPKDTRSWQDAIPNPIRGQVDCGYALVWQLTSNHARRCGESSVNWQPRFGQVISDSGHCTDISSSVSISKLLRLAG